MSVISHEMTDMRNLVDAPSLSRGGDNVASGGDETSSVIPVAGSARSTDEIAFDNDDDVEMLEDGAAKGPTGKQQMARMNLVEHAIPAAV
jgi:hypothetical protein